MKIVYQQRNKLKNTCILFPMTTDNSDNMLYYYYLINDTNITSNLLINCVIFLLQLSLFISYFSA